MIVFKTFWKVVKKYKGTIIMYTVMLTLFGVINMSSNQVTESSFTNSKPDVFIINQDEDNLITNNLVEYISNNSNLKEVKNVDDALFYRDVNYVIIIKNGYGKSVLNKENISLDIKSTGDYQASLEEMMLREYFNIQSVYSNIAKDEKELVSLINENLKNRTSVDIVSKLDVNKTNNMATYFNFASYSIMAVVIFIICLVISSFKENLINRRTIISSMNYKKFNKYLLLASLVYAFILWLLFVCLGVCILGSTMFSLRGLVYSLNSFVFTYSSLVLALLISTLVRNKEAVNGIVNVIALGSSFLCGAFVPAEWLPESVLKLAHVLPTYYYINSNDLLKNIQVINLESLKPIFINIVIILCFSLLFIFVNNLVTKFKRLEA